MDKQSTEEKKLWPWLKWFFLLMVAPVITVIIELICGFLGQYRALTCTSILAASIGLSITCFAVIRASSYNDRGNYLLIISLPGILSAVVFSVCIEPEITNTVTKNHEIFSFILAAVNAVLCWVFTFIVDVLRPWKERRVRHGVKN